MYRQNGGALDVFLVHPGGPFFANRDEGCWTIPKGLPEEDEALQATAIREFQEETGVDASPPYLPLGSIRQRGGKTVHAWAFEGEWPEGHVLNSNTFTLEWPRGSGQMQTFPEVDQGQFFDVDTARQKINAAQVDLIDRLQEQLASGTD